MGSWHLHRATQHYNLNYVGETTLQVQVAWVCRGSVGGLTIVRR